MRYTAAIPDPVDYWRRLVSCREACPVRTDARGYVQALREGDPARAYAIARGPNPLASVCGRVCAAPCEAACRRNGVDAGVAIRALKGFAAANFGPEARPGEPRAYLQWLDAMGGTPHWKGLGEFWDLKQVARRRHGGGAPVHIVGAGPAGLACAHDLALLGFRPVVFEREAAAGGMLRIGVPEYRLPRGLLDAEVEAVRALGVEIRTGVEVGRDVSVRELAASGVPLVLATGAPLPQIPDLPGVGLPGIRGGVAFLRQVALTGTAPLGDRVVVIGGGNVALDAARTALRLLRSRAGGEVTIAYRRTRQESPPYQSLQGREEIEETLAEGVAYREGLWPEGFEESGGRVARARFAEKRPGRGGGEIFLEATDVLLCIGQVPDFGFLGSTLEPGEKGYLSFDPETFRAGGTQDVYVVGDAAYGPGLIIEAVAAGKKAAWDLFERRTGWARSASADPSPRVLSSSHLAPGYDRLERSAPPRAPVGERLRRFACPVEDPYAGEDAVRQGARCLDCSVNTIFDSERCILCAGCVDVCPESCLRIAPPESVTLVAGGEELPAPADAAGLLLKDESRCIRCGLCARRCPVGAITMERFEVVEGVS